MSSKETEKEISRFTKRINQYREVKSRTVAENQSIQSIWGLDVLALFIETNPSTLKYVASCCKKQRDYLRARRMVNHLVVNRLLKPSRSTLSLSARLKVKVNDWIQISNQKLDDSEILHEILIHWEYMLGNWEF